jgi:thioredoxin 1
MSLIHFNKETFEEAMKSDSVVLVDFWAAWCGPCQMMGPLIDKMAQLYEGRALVGKVNIDEEQELAITHGVMSIPTVIFFKNGKEISRQVGLNPSGDPIREFSKILDENL